MATRAARGDDKLVLAHGADRDGREGCDPFGHSFYNRGPLSTYGQTEGDVLHVAARHDLARSGEQGCTHGEFGVRNVRLGPGEGGGFEQTSNTSVFYKKDIVV